MQKKYLEDHFYAKLVQWAYWALMANLCFSLTNSPLFLVITCFEFSFKFLPYYLLSSLLIIPSFTAIFRCIAQFIATKELTISNDYFSYLRGSLKATLPFALLTNFMLAVLYLSLNFFTNTNQVHFLPIFYLILTVFLISYTITYAYFVAKNPELSIRQILSGSFYLSLKKWYITLLNGGLYLLSYLALFVKPALGFFILPTLFSVLIYLNSLSILTKKDQETPYEDPS